MKGFLLISLLLVSLLLVNGRVIVEAAADNLAGIEALKRWHSDPKDLSQIICAENTQPVVVAPKDGRTPAVIAARRAYFAGDCETALATWVLVEEIDPQDETAAIMQFLSSGLDREMQPEGLSDAALAGFLKRLGLLAERRQNLEQARFWFANAFDIQPSRSVAERLVPLLQNQDEQAAIWQELSNALPQDDIDYWWALGQNAELQQRWDRAAEVYGFGAEIAPKPYPFLMRQGAANVQMMDWEEAIVSFQKASAAKPAAIEPYLEIGHIHYQQGNLADALLAYEQALTYTPNSFLANYYTGMTFFNLQDDKKAQDHLLRALDRKPKHANTAYFLAQSLYRDGDLQPAINYLDQAIAFKKDKPWEWLVTLGDWRYTAGDVGGALVAYEKALEIIPDNFELRDKVNDIEESR